MLLEGLSNLVEKLRDRIDNHGNTLSRSEAQTRQELIDPLLRELGWDTGNRDLVIFEYKTDDRESPDYVLRSNGQPVMMVEAKKLGTHLQKARAQGCRYSLAEPGTPYFSVTDGQRWEIYATYKSRLIDEKEIVKQIAEFDLKDQSPTEASLKTLELWKLRMLGHLGVGQAPDSGLIHSQPVPPSESQPRSTPPLPPGKWQSLSKLNPKTGSRPPVEIQFPDNSVIEKVTAWKSLLVEVVRWLIDNNYLTQDDCPILSRPTGKTHCAVHTKPTHLSDRPFSKSHDTIGSFHIETSLNIEAVTTAAQNVIKRVKQDPAQFKVRFS